MDMITETSTDIIEFLQMNCGRNTEHELLDKEDALNFFEFCRWWETNVAKILDRRQH